MEKRNPLSRKETTPGRFVLHGGFFLIGVRRYKRTHGKKDKAGIRTRNSEATARRVTLTLPCLCFFLKRHPRPDSNRRPTDQASNALPTELRGCSRSVQTTRW